MCVCVCVRDASGSIRVQFDAVMNKLFRPINETRVDEPANQSARSVAMAILKRATGSDALVFSAPSKPPSHR